MPGLPRRHPKAAMVLTLIVVLGVTATLVALSRTGNSATAVDPRTRVYADRTACLLTDANGTTVGAASAAWSGMQQAAKTTSERTSTLPITGAQTLQSAETYLNTLALQGCETIIGAGNLPAEAVQARASAFPHTRFIAVTNATGTSATGATSATATPSATNVTLLPAGTADAISNDVSRALLSQ